MRQVGGGLERVWKGGELTGGHSRMNESVHQIS